MPTTMPKILRLDTHISLVDPDADYKREVKRAKTTEINDEATATTSMKLNTSLEETKHDFKVPRKRELKALSKQPVSLANVFKQAITSSLIWNMRSPPTMKMKKWLSNIVANELIHWGLVNKAVNGKN